MISDAEIAWFRAVAGQPLHDASIEERSAQGLSAQWPYDRVFETLGSQRVSD